jgi:hypothetical protein
MRPARLAARREATESDMGGQEMQVTRSRLIMLGGIALVLLVPLVAMGFTDAVNWTAFDFLAAALILGAAALAWETARRVSRSAVQRMLAGFVIAGLVAIVWAHGAVGIY